MSTIMTSSGLQYEDITIGDGAEATAGVQVTVHYTGWLQNADGSAGNKFDSSKDRDEPFDFPLGAGCDPGLGPGRARHESGRRAQIDHPVRTRLRCARRRRRDPAECDLDF